MEHKTEARTRGGKDVSVGKRELLKSLIEDLEIKMTVKGFKSSEGDEVFEQEEADDGPQE